MAALGLNLSGAQGARQLPFQGSLMRLGQQKGGCEQKLAAAGEKPLFKWSLYIKHDVVILILVLSMMVDGRPSVKGGTSVIMPLLHFLLKR